MDNWRWAGVPFYLRSGKKLGQSRQVITHQAMCYFAYLSGCRLVHQAARDPLYRVFLLGYMDLEAIPTLPPVPAVDLGRYKHTLIERFSNPQVRDTITRLCAQSSDRIPK